MTFAFTIRFVTPDWFQSASRVSGEVIGVKYFGRYLVKRKVTSILNHTHNRKTAIIIITKKKKKTKEKAPPPVVYRCSANQACRLCNHGNHSEATRDNQAPADWTGAIFNLTCAHRIVGNSGVCGEKYHVTVCTGIRSEG